MMGEPFGKVYTLHEAAEIMRMTPRGIAKEGKRHGLCMVAGQKILFTAAQLVQLAKALSWPRTALGAALPAPKEQSARVLKAVATFDDAKESYQQSGAPMRFILDERKSDGRLSGLAVHFQGRRLTDIKQNDLDKAARELYPDASRATLIRQVYTPFIAVWNHGARREMCDVRAWERPRKPRGTNAEKVKIETRRGTAPVEYDRAARFVAAMSPAPAMPLTAIFYSGLRPIEAFALEAGDISIDKRWMVVRRSKTGEPRGVPLHWFLCEWLRPLVERAAADGLPVFRTSRGKPYTVVQEGGGGLKTAINGARKRSGIKDVSPYTGRHSVSTALVVAGVHPHIKDQILGHAVNDMSRHYTNVPQAPLIEAIDKLAVPDAWRALPLVASPRDWWSRLVEGTGKRTDLEDLA